MFSLKLRSVSVTIELQYRHETYLELGSVNDSKSFIITIGIVGGISIVSGSGVLAVAIVIILDDPCEVLDCK